MKKASLLLLSVLALAAAAAQNPPSVTAQPNSVYVSAEGKFEAPPDTALIQFNLSVEEDSPRAAYDRAAQESEQVRRILRDNGVDPRSAEVGFFSLQPVYDYKQPARRIVGYRVFNSVTLKLRDFKKVGPIVQQLGAREFDQNISLSYTLQDIDAAKQRAVQDALQRARAEAATVAQAGGRTLGELSYASVDQVEPVHLLRGAMPRVAMAAQAQAPAPTQEFSPQQITVTARVSAVFALK